MEKEKSKLRSLAKNSQKIELKETSSAKLQMAAQKEIEEVLEMMAHRHLWFK